MSKCDLHIHSRFSARSEEWLFRRFDFPDSYSDPTHLHHLGFHSFDYFSRDAFENFTYGAGGFRILERRLTFGGNLILDGLGRFFAGLSVDFYEKHLAWIFPARNLYCKLSVIK